MGQRAASVAAIILSYNKKDDSLACLKSVFAMEHPNLHVVAVDNASSDACGIASLSASQTAFDCSDEGSNNVTLTVTDKADLVCVDVISRT